MHQQRNIFKNQQVIKLILTDEQKPDLYLFCFQGRIATPKLMRKVDRNELDPFSSFSLASLRLLSSYIKLFFYSFQKTNCLSSSLYSFQPKE